MSKKAKIFLSIAIAVVLLIFVCVVINYYNNSDYAYERQLAPRAAMDEVASNEMGMVYGSATGLGSSEGALSKVKSALTKSKSAGSSAPSSQVVNDSSSGQTKNTTERLIIKKGSFSIVVKDVVKSAKAVGEYAIKKGGFLVSSNIYKNQTSLAFTATVVVRIPAKEFDSGVGEYKKLGEVKSQSVTGQDVTEEYVDLSAQMKNLKATEEQFLTIMKKAVEIKDILSVQRELTNVRSQIERLQGRLKYLEQSASLSTITVYLSTDSESLPVVTEDNTWKPIKIVKEALRSLLEVGKSLSYLVIWFVVYIPLWIVIGLSVLLIRWLYRRVNSKKVV
ncbi:MAG: DUF4349 domain-containing protein [Parcubacteria group bacterium]|nr:DUF4349 domain-containing protein [Parcubacteria group bacterium]